MPDLLTGVRAKIARAEENIKNLNTEITAILSAQPPPYTVVGQSQNNGREYALIAFGDPAVPPRLPVLVGEIVHNLRSSLDHLITALVIKNGGKPARTHQFPICTSIKKFEETRARGFIKGITPSAEKIIRSVQPYTSGTPDDTTLYVIQDLNNHDKHRLLIVTTTVATIGDKLTIGTAGQADTDIHGNTVNIVGMSPPSRKEISKDGIEIFRFFFAEPAPNFKANTEVAAQIVFAELGKVKLAPVVQMLDGLRMATVHTVGLFSGEF